MSLRNDKKQTGKLEPSGTWRTDLCSYNDSCKNAPDTLLVDFRLIRFPTYHNTLLYFTYVLQQF